MKNYQDVVNDRFDQEENVENSIYSVNHPIGKYTHEVIFAGMKKALLWYKKEHGALSSKKLLDVGCGDGGMIQFFIESGFEPTNTTGIDLSQVRIDRAKARNIGSNFKCEDAIYFQLEKKFDLIVSFDLYSHFNTEEQIVTGLKNKLNHLAPNGVFFWYDIYSKDHFSPAENADSWGFNKKQMIELAEKAGFEVVLTKPFFKNFFNRYHSIYQVKRLSPRVVKTLEMILPGMPGNLLLVLKKKDILNQV
ncbi:MAG: class I SAM-dependent methyltransferase [Crocinitomicaceae bacterium]|nr:class I SAM-dependent methyltransferase [Crocinitomicaceae bacterium]